MTVAARATSEGVSAGHLRALLAEIAREYPPEMVAAQLNDIPRQVEQIQLVEPWRGGSEATICDVGGGLGLFSVGCAAVGWNAILVDDFNDPVNAEFGQRALAPHRKRGVNIISRDAAGEGLDLPAESLDVVTTFHAVEHFHRSPKRLFHDMLAALKPGGLFFMAVPNAVNLRKRLSVPFGRSNWSRMDDWYEQPAFRGHVREPAVADLVYIARDLKLRDVRIFGRNWTGTESRRSLVRFAARAADRTLRLVPSLCSDLQLMGLK